eukprot:2233349-Pyramimonas_sp.AAC.1
MTAVSRSSAPSSCSRQCSMSRRRWSSRCPMAPSCRKRCRPRCNALPGHSRSHAARAGSGRFALAA